MFGQPTTSLPGVREVGREIPFPLLRSHPCCAPGFFFGEGMDMLKVQPTEAERKVINIMHGLAGKSVV